MSFKLSLSSFELNESLFSESFLTDKFEEFKQTIHSDEIGFFRLPGERHLLEQCKNTYQSFKHKKSFVHVGIGGSSLGPEMIVSALQKDFNQKFIFINNIDPDFIFQQLKDIDLEETLFYFVSKSGGTAETMAGLAIVSQLLNAKGIKEENFFKYMIFATDPKTSQLLDLGKDLGITCLEIPSNVGGRFSVLTPVGLLPALFAGIDCNSLLDGANKQAESILSTSPSENQLLKVASSLMSLKEQGVTQTVFMPYSSRLRNLAFWFVQLWAESLGKKFDQQDNKVSLGLTPIPGYGATDQHSQMQLFMEGPYDKCLIFIDIKEFEHQLPLKNSFSAPSLSSLSNFSLAELMTAEFEGTLKALDEEKRPYIRLSLQKADESALGSLILFFESLTALMGHYLNIDPFDQPGVEAGKRYAKQWLATSRQK